MRRVTRARTSTQLHNRNLTNTQLATLITRGIPGKDMPAIKIDNVQVQQVIAYLRSFNGPACGWSVATRNAVKRCSGERLAAANAIWSEGKAVVWVRISRRLDSPRSKAFLIREMKNSQRLYSKGL